MTMAKNDRFSLVVTLAIDENVSFSGRYSFAIINMVLNGLKLSEKYIFEVKHT